jgi:MtrB/PioB family decaheme-associated outer membrane protein
LLLTCAASALLGGGAISGARAANVLLKAPPPPDTGWWYQGYVEFGGRAFINDPSRNLTKSQGGSLAKYYEYSTIKPGPFANGHWAAGTKDGVFDIDFWAKNVGYDDQRYSLGLEKAGEHYLDLGWDQTPHLYSTSAQTLYNGVGTTALTLPPGLANTLRTASGNANPIAPANVATVRSDINAAVHQTDIGIRRDTASVEYRYTPTTAWDFKLNYSDMHRTGTQIDGVVFSAGTSGVVSQVPKPVNDTTQNYGASGEYVGTTPWDKKFSFKAAYSGSTYTDDFTSYTVENPFCLTADTTCARVSAPVARMTLAPSNQANAGAGTFAADLPLQSRYMGTVSYTMMRQNEAFLPFTINPNPALTIGGKQAASLTALPTSSLNGAIDTLLVNNVLTTQITPQLKSKVSYRYYNYDNDTPETVFSNWIVTDVACAGINVNGCGGAGTTAQYAPVRSLAMNYTKQNGGAELVWHPDHKWNVGAAYGVERYDWTRESVDSTTENSANVFADWKPVMWVTGRASWTFGDRREGKYDYPANVGTVQWLTLPNPYNPVTGGSTQIASAYRQFYLDNRKRNKVNFQVGVDVLPGVTVTPSFSLLNDDYNLDPTLEGVTSDHSYHSGVEVAYTMSPATRFLVAYMHELSRMGVTSGVPGTATGNNRMYNMTVQDTVNTVMVGIDHTLIPDKLDLQVSYTLSMAYDSQPLPTSVPDTATQVWANYPDMTSQFTRLDAIAKYHFDDDVVRRLGWRGKVTATFRYAWERSSVGNWQNDMMQTYMYSASNRTVGYMTWLNYDNPNYNVQMVMGSLGFTW